MKPLLFPSMFPLIPVSAYQLVLEQFWSRKTSWVGNSMAGTGLQELLESTFLRFNIIFSP
jgi:hypothetical protein